MQFPENITHRGILLTFSYFNYRIFFSFFPQYLREKAFRDLTNILLRFDLQKDYRELPSEEMVKAKQQSKRKSPSDKEII
jgi:hypothetical protein